MQEQYIKDKKIIEKSERDKRAELVKSIYG